MDTAEEAGPIKLFGERRVFWVQDGDIRKGLDACASGLADTLGFSRAQGFRGDALPDAELLRASVPGLVLVYAEDIDSSRVRTYTHLQYLALHDYSGIHDLSQLENLTELRLDWRKGLVLPPRQAPISRLYIRDYGPDSGSLAELPPWDKLSSLEMIKGGIHSLEGLQRFSGLRSLSLSYLSRLTDVSALGELPVIEELEFDCCKKAVDLLVISRCASLRVVRLSKCGAIASVRFVEHLEQLESFSFVGTVVEDGDLSPLLDVEYVGFIGKRNYSHTFKYFADRSVPRNPDADQDSTGRRQDGSHQ